jgi:hypothetical protein
LDEALPHPVNLFPLRHYLLSRQPSQPHFSGMVHAITMHDAGAIHHFVAWPLQDSGKRAAMENQMKNPTEIAVLRMMLRQVNVKHSALVRSIADASKTARLDELRTQRSA